MRTFFRGQSNPHLCAKKSKTHLREVYFASLSQNPLIFEHRTEAYTLVCEEHRSENQWILVKIVEI